MILKAKALDIGKIREETSSQEVIEKKAKKEAEKEPEKEQKAEKVGEVLDEEALQEIYAKETGKSAVYRGKMTKAYKDWRKEKTGKK
jgi:hypothetical protein